MTNVLILGFIIGVLAADGVLHFIEGARGMKMPVFGKLMPSIIAVIWGWYLLVVSVLLWFVAPMATYPMATIVSISIGVLIAGIVFSQGWIKNIVHKKI
jgi:hypothetical protein